MREKQTILNNSFKKFKMHICLVKRVIFNPNSTMIPCCACQQEYRKTHDFVPLSSFGPLSKDLVTCSHQLQSVFYIIPNEG